MRAELMPSGDQVYGWIEQVFRQGVRRPGYPADRWAEDFIEAHFRAVGLRDVRRETVTVPVWEPLSWSLTVTPHGGAPVSILCYPLPHTASATAAGDLAPLDGGSPAVRDAIAVDYLSMGVLPFEFFAARSTWVYDPDGTFEGFSHVLPFSAKTQLVMEPALEAGAAAYVGVLEGYPPATHDYYVPYDGVLRPIPGVWVARGAAGPLRDALAAGGAQGEVRVEARREEQATHNIVGELPGRGDEWVIIGSHHDGPWSSAVEDGSGIAMVLAQASYWSAVPQDERPHNLLFLLTSGHMCGGAGTRAFIAAHADLMAATVLELHLEHAALEHVDRGGKFVPTGRPEPRWWFTSRSPRLEAGVRSAIEAEGLGRSLIVPPTLFGERPTTDGGAFHLAGVPLVNFLTAPVYLFDSQDTLDKIDRGNLAAIGRAAARIVESTRDETARSMREGVEAAREA